MNRRLNFIPLAKRGKILYNIPVKRGKTKFCLKVLFSSFSFKKKNKKPPLEERAWL
jgi:hypothetical protein